MKLSKFTKYIICFFLLLWIGEKSILAKVHTDNLEFSITHKFLVKQLDDAGNIITKEVSGDDLQNISKESIEKVIRKIDEIVAKVNNIDDFIKLSISQKLKYLEDAWKASYPQIFFERRLFEKMMGQYRYTKSNGWAHTADIAHNFKGVDFYKGTEIGNQIFANTAVSMKTTKMTDVNKWLNSKPIQDNLRFLKEGLSPAQGIASNGKLMKISNAEIHIYMPKENITDELKISWLNKLSTINPKIKFEIKALEEFIK